MKTYEIFAVTLSNYRIGFIILCPSHARFSYDVGGNATMFVAYDVNDVDEMINEHCLEARKKNGSKCNKMWYLNTLSEITRERDPLICVSGFLLSSN